MRLIERMRRIAPCAQTKHQYDVKNKKNEWGFQGEGRKPIWVRSIRLIRIIRLIVFNILSKACRAAAAGRVWPYSGCLSG